MRREPHRLHGRRGSRAARRRRACRSSSGTACSSAESCRAGSARATRCGSRSATRCTGTTSGPRPTRSPPGLGWVCALDKDFTGADELRRIKDEGPAQKLVAFVMEDPAIPRQGMAIVEGGEVTSGSHSPMLERGIGLGYVPAELAHAGLGADDRRSRQPEARPCREEAHLPARGELMAAAESYPDDLRYHPEHDWARVDGDEATLGITWFAQDALGELVHFEAPEEGATLTKDQAVRRGRVGQGRLGRDRPALGRGARGQPRRRRRARDGERRSLRRGLARPCAADRARGSRRADRTRRRTSSTWPSRGELPRADRRRPGGDARGRSASPSIEELFADLPAGVRLGRELDLAPAMSEQELNAYFESLAPAEPPRRRRALVPRRRHV